MADLLGKGWQQSYSASQGKPGRYRPDILMFSFGAVMLAVSVLLTMSLLPVRQDLALPLACFWLRLCRAVILLLVRSGKPADARLKSWVRGQWLDDTWHSTFTLRPRGDGSFKLIHEATVRPKGESYFNLNRMVRVDFLQDGREEKVALFTEYGSGYTPSPDAWRPRDVRRLQTKLRSDPGHWIPVDTRFASLDDSAAKPGIGGLARAESGRLPLVDSYIDFSSVVRVEFQRPPYDDSLLIFLSKGELATLGAVAILYGDRDPAHNTTPNAPNVLGIVERPDAVMRLKQRVGAGSTEP